MRTTERNKSSCRSTARSLSRPILSLTNRPHSPSALAPGLSPPLGCGSRPSLQLSGEKQQVVSAPARTATSRCRYCYLEQQGFELQGQAPTYETRQKTGKGHVATVQDRHQQKAQNLSSHKVNCDPFSPRAALPPNGNF